MSDTLTPVPDCEESPLVIGGSTSTAGAACGTDKDDPNACCTELAKEVRCLRAEVVELQRVVRLLRRSALRYVTSPSEALTGTTYDGAKVEMPIPVF